MGLFVSQRSDSSTDLVYGVIFLSVFKVLVPEVPVKMSQYQGYLFRIQKGILYTFYGCKF